MFRRLANRLIDKAAGALIDEAERALAPHIKSAASDLVNAVVNAPPSVRSTGGATSVCLTKIKSDFKDFHAEDADTAITSFVYELIEVKYGGKESFEKANISNKIKINVSDKKSGDVSNIVINGISIANYDKSLNSATIKYRVSVGFNTNGSRQEKLYEVEYTLQLRDEYGAQTFLECKNCGAPLEEESGVCKYCGMKHLCDTTSSWVIADYKEL